MEGSTPRAAHVRLAQVLLIALMVVGSLALWVVIPVFWIWLASRLQKGSSPTLGPYLLVLFGIPVSMVIVGKILTNLNGLYSRVTGKDHHVRVRMPWNQSMRGERTITRAPRTVLDVVMVISVGSAAFVFLIWFFFFAHATLPG
jgi:hypothetical protein